MTQVIQMWNDSYLYFSRTFRWSMLQTDHCVPDCETSDSGAGQGCLGNPTRIPQTGGQTGPRLLWRSVDGSDFFVIYFCPRALRSSAPFGFFFVFLTICSIICRVKFESETQKWGSGVIPALQVWREEHNYRINFKPFRSKNKYYNHT